MWNDTIYRFVYKGRENILENEKKKMYFFCLHVCLTPSVLPYLNYTTARQLTKLNSHCLCSFPSLDVYPYTKWNRITSAIVCHRVCVCVSRCFSINIREFVITLPYEEERYRITTGSNKWMIVYVRVTFSKFSFYKKIHTKLCKAFNLLKLFNIINFSLITEMYWISSICWIGMILIYWC